jgi:glyoxylase-like metal-dependent hydrolase (beta-lactamase superfamily II)
MLALLSDPRFTPWLPVYAWLIESGGKQLLVDTGESPQFGTPEYFPATDAFTKHVYHRLGCFQNDQATGLTEQLHRAGTTIDQIDQVVFTHLHGDHVGNAELVAGRPIRVERRELESTRGTGRLPQKLPSASCIETVDWSPDKEVPGFEYSATILPNSTVKLLHTPGHTPGHVSVLITGDRFPVLLAGDLAFCESQAMRGGLSAIVEDERLAIETMSRVRELAHSQRAVCLFTHDPTNASRLSQAIATI